jgi:general secretion pathway protein D
MAAPTPAPITPSQATPPPHKNMTAGRLWNLQDADILSVINEVSLETHKNFVVDPRVTGKISLISSKPIQPHELYQVFLSILELLGYSAIPTGDIVKIVPNMESSELATHIATNQSPGKGDEVVVRVIPLENVSAMQILPVLRPMLPQWSNISVYAPGNVLILVGRAANLQRIMNIVQSLDSASNNNIEVIPLHQASAAQVATVLSNLQSASRANGDTTPLSIAADERSNSILLSGNKASRLKTHALISQLDAPVTGARGNTKVIYLRYLQAKNLAPILGKIAQNIQHSDTASKTLTPQNLPGSTPAKETTPTNETNIQAEPSTNALIITAPPALMAALDSIVAKLDIRPAQVLVEAIIAEVDQDDLNNMGIQWGALSPRILNNLSNDTPDTTFGVTPEVSFPPLGAGTVGIIPSTQIKAVLSLLQNNTNVNILSTPSVVVLDNHRATLQVGQDVPTESGSYATTGSSSTVNPFTTIVNKPVVLKLDVIPQINLGSAVRLSIELQNDSLKNPDNPGLNPIINTSKIKNSVIINSEDILVIGGLISNSSSESIDKVPILGDIPGVGLLFQHKARKLQKKNLVAFIKPIILHNEEQANMITNSKYNYTRQTQINWHENLTNPHQQSSDTILPLWKNNIALPKPFEAP